MNDFSLALTVFTPTYNRAYLLRRVYESLSVQTFTDFEWLVIDDGSTDNTEGLIYSFISENRINIRYIKTKNGGKHRAMNLAAKAANGELFYILDSDDYLYSNALEIIQEQYKKIKNDQSYAGLWGIRTHPNEQKIGKGSFSTIDSTYLAFRYKYKISGDMAEVLKTNVLREFPFPDIEGEKFCSEGLIWTRIAQKYKTHFFYKKICICEYLEDGLTSSTIMVRINSPQYASVGYAEHALSDVPIYIKIKSAINFWRFSIYTKWRLSTKLNMIGKTNIVFLPLGLLFHLYDKIICRKKTPNINLKKINSR